MTFLERTFDLEKRGTTVKREILAGVTTYTTMAYILFVNPHILSKAGMDFGAVMVATILSAFIATMIMALFANYPFILGPGMGLNAYFAYGVVLAEGFSWQTALGACFIAGFLFLVLNAIGIRRKIMEVIPPSLRFSTAAGIGLFLAFVGFRNAELVIPHEMNIITIGNLTNIKVVMTGIGVVIIAALMSRKIPGDIFLGTFAIWLLSLLTGQVEWNGLVSLPPDPRPTFMQMDLIGAFDPKVYPIIISFVFIAIFDAAGSLLALAEAGNFLDKNGKLPKSGAALSTDAIGTMAGATLGTSPLTIYLESATGIAAGGRTGLTGVVTSLLLIASLFFVPFALSIPHYATSPALIVVGTMMLKQMAAIDWEDPSSFIPAFVILITIPLTFSIATGIAVGFILYPFVKLLSGKGEEVHWLLWVLAILFIISYYLGTLS